MAEVGLFEAMYTARALRRLKPDPVPDDVITKVLDAAIWAPSGGNAQNWFFIVVSDQASSGWPWPLEHLDERWVSRHLLEMIARSSEFVTSLAGSDGVQKAVPRR
jgi:nitroreductase